MNLADFTIEEVIYSGDDTVVARARSAHGDRVMLKYQDGDRPSPDLLARWQHEYAVLQSIDSEWVVKSLALKQVEHGLVLVLEDFASTNLAQLIARQPLDLSERMSLAIQLASADECIKDVARLLAGVVSRADQALYQAKRAGTTDQPEISRTARTAASTCSGVLTKLGARRA